MPQILKKIQTYEIKEHFVLNSFETLRQRALPHVATKKTSASQDTNNLPDYSYCEN